MSEANPFLSPESPIKPLGILKTEGIFVGDAEIIVISALQLPVKLSMKQLGKNHLIFLCGGIDWLERTFWRCSGAADANFNGQAAAEALITACCSLGIATLNWGRLFDANGELVWPLPSESTAP
ncbi:MULTISPECIES: hypothetical protein [unclassified Novosphingobium]|uniref:hypothetical protein n=1 Tax=unclassified Novosphingobium TaxID=2644732 RepID=UPI000D2F9013|nr:MULTISPECIES: hypothetical protein [unclassified Novosphingobium]PTR07892.1 hypothetical protein C8K11_113103 [Novosphingobium sp. GV055]PUB00705.1 hypothetical protein C8K12_113103 [Novosphingobium sp. GV061]PUB16114.1 hypothetical protein C8K14_113103 [Novosphingobium sp. GV079]PUB39579.1 hypothetical protein C8K10_113103 [Novosphingobium sp. GV027]